MTTDESWEVRGEIVEDLKNDGFFDKGRRVIFVPPFIFFILNDLFGGLKEEKVTKRWHGYTCGNDSQSVFFLDYQTPRGQSMIFDKDHQGLYDSLKMEIATNGLFPFPA